MRAMVQLPEAPEPRFDSLVSQLNNQPYSAECCDFMTHCCLKDITARWNIEKLLEHPFLKRASSLQQLMEKLPPLDIDVPRQPAP